MSWFKEWFNTPYYHVLYRNRDFTEAERFIDNLVSYFKPNEKTTFLDLACGKGRHSIYLNSKGYQVTGVDLSEESIRVAKEKANHTLRFDVHDMRQLYSKQKFDYVFNLFTSFGYFDDSDEDLSVLKSVNQMLNEEGVLVLDYLNAFKVKNDLVTSQNVERDKITFSISKSIENQFVVKDINFHADDKEYHFQERVKLLSEQQFDDYFELTGFKVLAKFGDYDLNEFCIQSSPRLILIAKKSE